ncbi:hypothetical protein T265_12693, partial [Opisthorchis viverrini]
TLVVDQVAVDLFAELGNWLANVSSPYEEASSGKIRLSYLPLWSKDISNTEQFVRSALEKLAEFTLKITLVVDQVAVDLFAELGNWLANVSSPYEEASSVRTSSTTH